MLCNIINSYDYQTNARNYLRDAFKNKVSVDESDHGDRSGGLLIGYVGLITVPVAYN